MVLVNTLKVLFHLPNHQLVIFNEDYPVDEITSLSPVGKSKLLAWIEANRLYPEERYLTYLDFSTKFVWVLKTRTLKPREHGFAIGRIKYVPPSCVEAYYFRVLLNLVKRTNEF